MTKILFLGDICTDTYSIDDLNSFQKTDLYKLMQDYEGYIIGNLEAPLLENYIIENQNKYSLLNKPSLFEMYDFCNAFVLANNHIFDQGFSGYNETIKFLTKKNKKYFGAGRNLREARKPIIIEDCDSRIFLFSYNCYSTNSELNAKNSTEGTSPLVYEYIVEDIKHAKSIGASMVIIVMHWGLENEFYPTIEQVALARKVIDAGADGIISSHTHTIQAYEIYKNKSIYYGLGNFLFNNFQIDNGGVFYQNKFNKEGMLVELEISNNTIYCKEYFIKLDDDMIPELSSINDLKTNIKALNSKFGRLTATLKHHKYRNNLQISLKYNGEYMQLVYDANALSEDIVLKYESIKVKLKSIIYQRLKNEKNIYSNK